MKARLSFSALGLLVLMAACQKETMPDQEQQTVFAPPPSERCACMAPVELDARNATDVSIDLIWNAMPEALAYRIEVADQFNGPDALGTILFDETIEGTRITVDHLAPNTRYQYRITTYCGNDTSEPSEIQSFVTADFHHGDPDQKPDRAQNSRSTATQ